LVAKISESKASCPGSDVSPANSALSDLGNVMVRTALVLVVPTMNRPLTSVALSRIVRVWANRVKVALAQGSASPIRSPP
jgi:hypothetical protein